MQTSVLTSELLTARVKDVLPKRLETMRKAIIARDFETFARVTMQDSNQLHAICLDTFPPLIYLGPASFLIMRLVHTMNATAERIIAAYSCDAGANVCLFVLENDAPQVLRTLQTAFPIRKGSQVEQVPVFGWNSQTIATSQEIFPCPERLENGLTRIICSEVGMGPAVISVTDN